MFAEFWRNGLDNKWKVSMAKLIQKPLRTLITHKNLNGQLQDVMVNKKVNCLIDFVFVAVPK